MISFAGYSTSHEQGRHLFWILITCGLWCLTTQDSEYDSTVQTLLKRIFLAATSTNSNPCCYVNVRYLYDQEEVEPLLIEALIVALYCTNCPTKNFRTTSANSNPPSCALLPRLKR
jgi:hypothetical protein